eukprot:8924774-Alexandrium_andersonii.AAC.1
MQSARADVRPDVLAAAVLKACGEKLETQAKRHAPVSSTGAMVVDAKTIEENEALLAACIGVSRLPPNKPIIA